MKFAAIILITIVVGVTATESVKKQSKSLCSVAKSLCTGVKSLIDNVKSLFDGSNNNCGDWDILIFTGYVKSYIELNEETKKEAERAGVTRGCMLKMYYTVDTFKKRCLRNWTAQNSKKGNKPDKTLITKEDHKRAYAVLIKSINEEFDVYVNRVKWISPDTANKLNGMREKYPITFLEFLRDPINDTIKEEIKAKKAELKINYEAAKMIVLVDNYSNRVQPSR